ncbi:MAG: hypothetical protein VXW65_07485 [Pseudomonadota bacterium]|nr:hypothetical protein [Pseudomonadota bacterium]
MNMLHKWTASAVLLAGLAAFSTAHAESSFVTGAGAINADARLDFRIVIPKFIRFQVGSVGATIDLVDFDVPAANVGDGNAIARTNGGAVPVLLQSNAGDVSLTGTTTGGLTDGVEFISFDEITSTSSNADLAAPVLVDGGSSAVVTVTPNVGTRVVNRTANWTFEYENSNFVAAGTYGGVNTNNGRVVYTAALP